MTYSLYHTMHFSKDGFPIFNNNKGDIILAKNLDDYYFLLSHHNNEEAINKWLSNNPFKKINANANLSTLSEQETIAYQHFILPTSFQYMMHKHLFGYAHIIFNNSVFVFKNTPVVINSLYKLFGKKYANVDLFEQNNYDKFQEELLSLYNQSLITPAIEFSSVASDIIVSAISLARSQSFQFLEKNTKISFN